TDCIAPRRVGTRAFGRALPGVEVRVVDESDRDVPDGRPGEMLIRHSAATPRKAFFAGYLDDPAATEAAWRGGWFHTGDVVTRDADGMLHFFDRRKNIVRRSGENIAAAEVEAALLAHPLVLNAAVLAVADELRDEEVMACVVPKLPPADAAEEALLARELMAHCMASLAYYKAPGWLCFRAELPTTGTQKIRKHDLFGAGTDPRQAAGVIDLRALKTRRATP
ncbi:MAG TPA: AMP-binding protein, partial [Rubrivivax sp.]|nr:AMP-binding protein [Rubrivivax sp.]